MTIYRQLSKTVPETKVSNLFGDPEKNIPNDSEFTLMLQSLVVLEVGFFGTYTPSLTGELWSTRVF